MKTGGRPVPFRVTNLWDDLWLGVICQSNQEIAGSPRNIYRYSLFPSGLSGTALDGLCSASCTVQSNSELEVFGKGSQNDPAKRAALKGNNPDCPLRPLNNS